MRSFDDFQKEYTADGEKSYFTLSIPVDEQFKQYQTGMLEKNRLDLLLPLVVQRVNDDWKLSYDITSKIPLGRVLERKSLRHHEFDFIIRQFAALVHVLKEYLLDLPCVVFDKNYIFCDPADFTLFFVYIPVKSSESEPERIKNFLRKLIVEDIRLVDDISGSLLKKLLEALKSEAFTSELLYQCLDSTDVNQQVKSNVYATDLKEDFSNKAFTAEVYPNVPTRLDNSLEGTRHDENKNKQVQNNHPFSRSNTEHTPPPRPRKPAAIPSRESVKTVRTHETISCKAPVRKMNNMKPGFAFLQKYPKSSWLIAGGVNLLLLAILVYIIASVGKNPSNAVSNIAGFLLIAAAGNYFLCTRLFSKEKKLPVVEASIETRSAAFKKRFEFENDEEDIILPKNPAASFQRENNREKVVLPPVSHAGSSSSDRAIPGSDRTNDSNQADRTTPIFGMNQENGGKLNQKAQSAEVLINRADSAALSVEPEIEKTFTHSVLIQNEEQTTEVHAAAANDSIPLKDVDCPKASINLHSDNIVEPVKPQTDSTIQHRVYHAFNAKMEANQSFPDKTMILSRPSQQVPCLISIIRPYEKILLDKTPLMIGRLADSVDYVIQNRAVGKIHAEIIKSGDRYFIVDMNSVNGTYVNGERLVCNTETPMNSGDKVTLANESYTFLHWGQVPV